MVYRGRVKDGVVVLDKPSALPEGAEVRVELLGNDLEPPPATLTETLIKYAGGLEGLPSDLAAQHDHYIHGTPKR